MTDHITPEKRSLLMSRIKGRNTSPEKKVIKMLRAIFCKYRSNIKWLPGKPDIRLVGQRKIIFVNGCFWHGHKGCKRSRRPTSNVMFWNNKINGNIRRDKENHKILIKRKWKALIIWECTTRNPDKLRKIVEGFAHDKIG